MSPLRLQPLAPLLFFGALCTSFPAAGFAQAAWEYSPYEVRVWILADNSAQLPPPVQQESASAIALRAEAVFGPIWSARVESAPALAVNFLVDESPLAAEKLQELAPDVLKGDKLFVVRVAPGGLGWMVTARELDCRTRQWGPLTKRQAGSIAELTYAAWDAVAEAFVPLARIEGVEGAKVTARLRAAGLAAGADSPSLVAPGRILRPIVRRNDRSGQPIAKVGIQALPWTLLVVESRTDSLLTCKLHSGYRSSLPSKPAPRTERLALLVKPQFEATTLELRSRTGERKPLSGYQIYAKDPAGEAVTQLGASDWQGQIQLLRTDGALQLLLIRNGQQLLARLPVVPGQEERLAAELMDDDGRLQAEGAVAALHSRALDLLARREILASRFRTRLKERKFDEAAKFLDEFRKLESRAQLGQSLDEMQRAVTASDSLTKQRIEKLFTESRKLLTVKGLADDMVNTLAGELTKARAAPAGAAPNAAPVKAAAVKAETKDAATSGAKSN